MVVVKLMGGLGNQMFQYAAGRALALYHGTQLKVDTTFLERDSKGAYTQRKYELDIFNAPIVSLATADLERFLSRGDGLARRLANKIMPGLIKNVEFDEHGPTYRADFWQTPRHVYLNGYWQSEDYFKGYRDVILRDFQIKEAYLNGVGEVLAQIESSNSLAVHVRRGDYVSSAICNAVHGVCSIDYYELAVAHIAKKQANLSLFVFSDDLPWCKAHLNFAFPVCYVETGSAFKDLFLMQQCKHQVIANSSFSWWAAWLNRNPSKSVIAPKVWFQDPEMQSNDIVPGGWERF